MSVIAVIRSEMASSLRQHLRSPALWLMALAAPVAANYMVPPPGAGYAVMTLNGAYPDMTAAVLGLTLGVVTATILTPVAYIFLRAGPTRKRPGQITDVAPYSRVAAAIGRWLADTAILWLILVVLTLAGFVLGLLRVTEGEGNMWHTGVTLWLTAAPALMLIAAIRTLLDARPVLTRWPGDVLFFFIWIGLLVAGILAAETLGGNFTPQPNADAFGYIASIGNSTDIPIENFSLGSTPGVTSHIRIDALAGVMNPAFLTSRLFWIMVALGISVLAGLIYAPRRSKAPRQAGEPKGFAATLLGQSQTIAMPALSSQPAKAAVLPFIGLILSEMRLIMKDRAWLIALVIAGGMGAVLPWRMSAGPAIWIVLLFPLTSESARWQARSLRSLLKTSPANEATRLVAFAGAGIALMLMAHLPSIAWTILTGKSAQLMLMGAIIAGVPVAAALFAAVTRSAIAGRIILLIAWYGFLSTA